jgi:hypothetical protein
MRSFCPCSRAVNRGGKGLSTRSVTCKPRSAHTGVATLLPLTGALVSTGTGVTQIDLRVTQIVLAAPCTNTRVQSTVRTSTAALAVLLWPSASIPSHSPTRHTFKPFSMSTTFSSLKKLLVDAKIVHERKSKNFKILDTHTHTHTHAPISSTQGQSQHTQYVFWYL